jgi:hypothetical protein
VNLRNVLKVYSLQRQFSDDESALLATLRGLSDSERDLLVESLQPTKGTGKGVKKRTRATGNRSARATGLAATLNKNLAQQRKPMCAICGSTDPDDGDHGDGDSQHQFSTDVSGRLQMLMSNGDKCAFEIDSKVCKGLENDGIHDVTLGYVNYHEFVAPTQAASTGG